ncbi:MAG: ABC transporter substrate-binding protein [Anaerolineae bacterium]|jgi:multiple sugar transport system substrate-binding protein
MEARSWSRRKFLRAGALAMGGLLGGSAVAACTGATQAPAQATQAPAGATAPAAAATEQVTIEFWWGWTPDMIVNTLNAVADAFMEANPDIKVTTAQHEWGEKLLTAYAAGAPPDVHEHWLPMQFAARDLLLPVDDLVASSATVSIEMMPEVAWTMAAWQGARYAVPALAFFAELALIVNPAVYEKVGLASPDDIPTTWDEVFEQAKEYTGFDAVGNLDIAWIEPAKNLRHWPAMYGIEDYDEQNRRWLFDDPGWEEVVANIARFYTEFGPEKFDAFHEAYPGWIAVPGSAFASDRLAMVISGYWVPGELDANAPGKPFDYTWAPTGGAATGKKVTHWGAHSMMMPKSGRHINESWRLIEHYLSLESAQTILEGCGWVGPQRDFWEIMDASIFRGLDFFVDHIAKEADLEYVNSPSPAIAFAMNGFQEQVVDPVIYGEKTVKQALADFQQAVTEEEERFLQE